jgi:hypothetical protein
MIALRVFDLSTYIYSTLIIGWNVEDAILVMELWLKSLKVKCNDVLIVDEITNVSLK